MSLLLIQRASMNETGKTVMAHTNLVTSPATKTIPTAREGGHTTIADVHHDVLQEHIFTRLDGPALASAGCACSMFQSLSAEQSLWAHICSTTWPSTNTPRIRHVISTFPDGSRSFYADSFLVLAGADANPSADPYRPLEIISAVDIRHRGSLVFSKVVETETASDWFLNSPFRVDLLEPKDVIPTAIEYPESLEMCRVLSTEMRLSWIVIDPNGRRAVNMSSQRAVKVERHWLTGDIHVMFATVVGGGEEAVQIGVVVTCGEKMQVREVSLHMEDMDGKNLNGRDSLGIIQKSLQGKKGRKNVKEEEGKRRYEEYLERKKERKERKARSEGRLDTLCAALTVFVFSISSFFLLCR